MTDRDKESFNVIQKVHRNTIERIKTPNVEHIFMDRDSGILDRVKRENRATHNSKPNKGKKFSRSPKKFGKKKKKKISQQI